MKTLILFIDAFSYSDLNQKNCPFIYNLAKDGASGPSKISPSAYHTEFSMLSGCLPLKHNVWGWYYMNPKGSFSKVRYIKPILKLLEKLNKEKIKRLTLDYYINIIRLFQGKTRFLKTNKIPLDLLEKFEISVDKMHFEHNPLPVPTLFDVLRKNQIRYVGMEFPIISDNKKTSFYFTKGDFKEIKKAGKLLDKYNVVYLHVWSLDSIEHKYGLHSKESLNYIKNIDKVVKEVYSSRKEKINIIIFSDHGGVNVTKTKNILPILKKYECNYFIGSTSVQIWLKEQDKELKEKLKEELKKKDYLVYDEANIEKELFIPYKRNFVGDIMAYVKPGEQLYPDFFRDTSRVKSMHGYTKEVHELKGIFIINGFGIKNKIIKNMRLYDIAPTILGAMKIKPPQIWDGVARV